MEAKRRQKSLDSVYETFLPYLGVLAAVSVLMLKQPDFGTLTIILVPAIAIYVVAGLTWRQMGIGIAIVVVAFAGPPLVST